MPSHLFRSALLCSLLLVACSSDDEDSAADSGDAGPVGSVGVSLTLSDAVAIDSVHYSMTGPQHVQRSGAVPLAGPDDARFRIELDDVPAATGYQLEITGADARHGLQCRGDARFDVMPRALTTVSIHVRCRAANGGSLAVSASVEQCPSLDGIAATADLDATNITLHAWAQATLDYDWSASAGSLDTQGDSATLHCPAGGGAVAVHVAVGQDDCGDSLELDRMCPVDWSRVPKSSIEPLYGVTVDSIADIDAIVRALEPLARKPTARVVFDPDESAAHYATAVGRIHEVSSVMGELVDSLAVAQTSLDEYTARTRSYLDMLGDNVDIWEVGNEINGDWLGSSHDVVQKVLAAYHLVHERNKPTALTLYYNPGCWESADHEMFRWVSEQLPYELRTGPDYVLLSFYEDHCPGAAPDWNTVFARLAQLFPNSKLGFGECGTTQAARKASLIEHYYTLDIPLPQYIGGYFWWYFRQDMLQPNSGLWGVLDTALQNRPRIE